MDRYQSLSLVSDQEHSPRLPVLSPVLHTKSSCISILLHRNAKIARCQIHRNDIGMMRGKIARCQIHRNDAWKDCKVSDSSSEYYACKDRGDFW